jgi:predicted metal-binding protein
MTRRWGGKESHVTASTPQGAPIRILVCTSCRSEGQPLEPRDARAGAVLALALADIAGEGFEIVPVECMSVCKRPVTVGFSAADRWTYVYGDFPPEAAPDILDHARAYAATSDGIIPWKIRPEHLKRNTVTRLPPLTKAPAP